MIQFEAEIIEISVKQKNLDRVTKVVLSVPESDGKEAEKLTEFINQTSVVVSIDIPKRDSS